MTATLTIPANASTRRRASARLVAYPCDLCGSRDAIEAPYARRYTGNQPIHICKRCGLVYVKYRRRPEDVAATWSDQLFGPHYYTARIPAVIARQTYVAAFIDQQIGLRGQRVCDVGTGEGQFLEIIRRTEYGARVFGTEAAGQYCRRLTRQRLPCFNGTVEAFAAKPGKHRRAFDIVTLMWTLECCGAPRQILMACRELLKPNGHIVVATGSRMLVPFKKPLHLYLSTAPADTSPVRFSANTLHGLLAVCGFESVHANRYIDSDILCMIGRQRHLTAGSGWRGDDYRDVAAFFRRWHRETRYYKTDVTAAWGAPAVAPHARRSTE